MGHIEEVATRLKGLREALGLSVDEICTACGIEKEKYLGYEEGTADIPVSTAKCIAEAYGVEIMALLFGDEPKMRSYFITRKGCGVSVERRNWYKYQSLAGGFAGRRIEPFLVSVKPEADAKAKVHLSSHDGQEMDYVEQGSMELHIDGKVLTLNEGDTIMFDARRPHGMRAIGDKELKFIAVIV